MNTSGQLDVSVSVSAAGTTQATATILIGGLNWITTAAASSGVLLNAAAITGSSQAVYNGGANAVKVYPPTGAQINGLGANNPMTLGTNSFCECWFLSSTQVVANLSA